MYYYAYSKYLMDKFGARTHRLSLNAGITCPNKDGSLSSEGCVFCNEEAFAPNAATNLSLRDQIERGMEYARERFRAEKFIAYFQTGSNTNAPAPELKKRFDVIKEYPDIAGLSVSTRPDCVDEEKLDLIAAYTEGYDTWLELGVQTMHEKSLVWLGRRHGVGDSEKAIKMARNKGIKVGAHVILGIPGESSDDMNQTAHMLSEFAVHGVKIHVLHVLKNTPLEKMLESKKLPLMSIYDYVNCACDFLERLRPDCVVLRLVSDAREGSLIAPGWINEKQKVIEAVNKEFDRRGTEQGSKIYEKRMRVRQL